MENVSVQDIVLATGGVLLSGDDGVMLNKIRLDSRQVETGDLFVPIIGEKVDAHKFLEQVAEKGEYLKGRLSYFSKYNFITDICGTGLLQGMQLSPDVNGNYVASMLLQKGILINCTRKNFLRFLPPYTIEKQQIDLLCDGLEEIFANTNV